LVQIIPFITDEEPFFLPILARGLSDLSALRFNTFDIVAQINPELEFEEMLSQLDSSQLEFAWDGEELWLSGQLQGMTGNLSMRLQLYQPNLNVVVYQDQFQVSEKQFLFEWEKHFRKMIQFLKVDVLSNDDLRITTKSLEAFLAFRKGLEILTVTKNVKVRETGLESLVTAVAYDPDFTEAVDILILFLLQNDGAYDFERAIKLLERLRGFNNKYPRIPLVIAEFHYQAGNINQAERLLIEIGAAFPTFNDGWIRLALFYHAHQQPIKALEALEKILNNDPQNSTALDLMGAIYAGMNEYVKAGAAWQRVLELEPRRVNVITNLGLLAEENEDFLLAEKYFKQSILVNDAWWGSFFHYGTFYRRRGRLEEALEMLEKAATLNPEYFAIWHSLGLVQHSLGYYQEAQESFLKLLELAPDNQVRCQTLKLLEELDDPQIKIENMLRKLVQSSGKNGKEISLGKLIKFYHEGKDHWYYWYLLGKFFQKFNLNSLAIFFWQKGFKCKPGLVLIRDLGLLYYQKKQFKKAFLFLEEVYRINPSNQEIAQAYHDTLSKIAG